MRKYINSTAVPLSIAVYLATDHYDKEDDNAISVTGLLKPLKQIILASRVPQEMQLVDIAGLVQSRMGTSFHDGVERAWLHHHQDAMRALGYPEKVIQRVLVNPTPEELFEGCIPVYLERRTSREILGRKVTGKFDFVGDGRLEDVKSTSVYTWIHSTKDDDYIWQGSLYRWLNPDIITKDEMAIQFLFTDWSPAQARSGGKYPPSRTLEQKFPLKSVAETEAFITRKLTLLDQHWHADEKDMPACSDNELWRKDPVWKYYKNPQATGKSTKNFDNRQDAYLRLVQDKNVGVIKEYPGKAVACKYCPAFPVCQQAKDLVASGDLDL